MTTEAALDSTELRKARGAYFTPSEVTDFIARWAIRAASDRVLEPSCGDGAFLRSAVVRMRQLGEPTPLHAYELHEKSAAEARSLLTALNNPGMVEVGDFLATTATASFDAVVGNPPYIRYHGFTGTARARGLTAAFAQGVRLSKLASSWAPFVVHAGGHLAPTGRLALVLPAELLTSNYAQEVRDYLLDRFASVSVVLFGRHVFPGVQTEALLLLAEGGGRTRDVRFAVVDEASQLSRVVFDSVLAVDLGQRWASALVSKAAQQQLDSLSLEGRFRQLSDWGRMSLGAVTGNNRFFLLSPQQADDLGLSASDVLPVSPAGSSHLRALTITRSMHASLGDGGAKTLLFRPETPSPAALDYIAAGEAAGVQNAYKCRVRSPWWRTPLPDPPEMFFTYMNEATPQLATNPAGLHYVNSVHGLYVAHRLAGLAPLLALAALNSATALSAEITGRSYGGGILKLEPREAARLLVPSPETVRNHSAALGEVLPRARLLLEAGRLPEARGMVDDILFASSASPGCDVESIRHSHDVLSRRRRTRAASRKRK